MSSNKIKVGIFIVGGLALFAAGLFLIGSSSQLFAHKFDVYADFDNVDTLQPGTKVRVSGMDAGELKHIQIPSGPSSRFRFKMSVDDKFHPLIRKDSVVSVKTEGMVGNEFLDIKKGSAHSPECPAGGTLRTEEPVDMSELMRKGSALASTAQDTIQDIRKHADTTLTNFASVAGHADGIVVSVGANVKKIAANGAQMTGNANQIIAGVRQGHGAAGKLLVDRKVAADVTATVSNAKQASANVEQATRKVQDIMADIQKNDLPDVQKTLENAEAVTKQLDNGVGTFMSKGNQKENGAQALRDAVNQAQQAMTNLADDTEALKHNFFLRGFFKRRGYYNLDDLTPKKYAASEFVKKPAARVWVPSAGLFKSGPDGKQQLAKNSPAILDQSMSELAPYLPHNPIMVEGYAESGPPDHRFLVAKQRATEVRQYLISHFHLSPDLVGIMPLAEAPPGGLKKKVWDGVSLVLVAWKH